MKVCNHCNSQMEDYASFCPYCGQSINNVKEKEAFRTFKKNIKCERNFWLINGDIALLIGLIFQILSFANVFLYLATLLFLPISLINLITVIVLNKQLKQILKDPTDAKNRAIDTRTIVFSALFNPLAMIFVIKNHIHVKRNFDLIISEESK